MQPAVSPSLTKERIREMKHSDLPALYALISEKQNAKDLSFVLENLGFLPKDFDISPLKRLLYHANSNIRLLAIKNVGKLAKPEDISELFEKARHDDDTTVRREAVSALGRMRNEENIL